MIRMQTMTTATKQLNAPTDQTHTHEVTQQQPTNPLPKDDY